MRPPLPSPDILVKARGEVTLTDQPRSEADDLVDYAMTCADDMVPT